MDTYRGLMILYRDFTKLYRGLTLGLDSRTLFRPSASTDDGFFDGTLFFFGEEDWLSITPLFHGFGFISRCFRSDAVEEVSLWSDDRAPWQKRQGLHFEQRGLLIVWVSKLFNAS